MVMMIYDDDVDDDVDDVDDGGVDDDDNDDDDDVDDDLAPRTDFWWVHLLVGVALGCFFMDVLVFFNLFFSDCIDNRIETI